MTLNNYLYIFRGKGMQPECSVAVLKSEDFTLRIVGVSDLDDAVQIARDGIAHGAQLIELCGAFGAQGAQKIAEAINYAVPIGHVSYSLHDINVLHDMLSSNFKKSDHV